MIELFRIKSPQIWWYLLAFLIFAYLIVRAVSVPVVHDEAATFFHYVHPGYFFPPKALWDANNHYLNTILTWFSYQLFGSSPLALRLPNLLSFILFAICLFRIASLLKNQILQWILILAFFFCHGFIEFFNVTRGYGMSMALITTACWYCIQFIQTDKIKYQVYLIVFSFLSLTSNLTLLNSIIIILSYIQIFILYRKKEKGLTWVMKSTIINIVFGGFTVLGVVTLLFKMKVLGLLYYGQLSGFLDFSLPSFLRMLFEQINPLSIIISIFLIGFLGIATIYLLSTQKKISSLFSASWLFPLLFFGNLCAVVLMAKILKVNHPEDRTGLYFVLFFIFTIVFIADVLVHQFQKKWLIMLTLPLLAFPIDFIMHANNKYVTIWKEEYIPERFYHTIASDKFTNPTIGGYFMRRLCFAYHNFRNGGALNQMQCSKYPEYISDYQIVRNADTAIWLKHYDSIDYAPYSKLFLFRKKNTPIKIPVTTVDSIKCPISMQEYFNLFEGTADTLHEKNILVETSMSLNSPQKPPFMWVVVSIDDSTGKNIFYEFSTLHWKKTIYNETENNVQCSFSVANLPSNGRRFVVYIWNIHKQNYAVNNGQCVISEIKSVTDINK